MNAIFDSSRALDLSGLASAAKTPAASGSYVVEADDRTFEPLLQLSVKHPLIVEFNSPRANARQLSDDLAALANAGGGKYLLVRVNVDTARQVVTALAIQAVPMVVGIVAGQLLPLFQGTKDKADAAAVIDEFLAMAAANGVLGRAQPVGEQPEEEVDDAVADPRFDAADAAMEAGDFAAAVGEFDKILAATPGDAEATAGRAGARLLVRLTDKNPAAVMTAVAASPGDVDAQLDAADLELAGGNPQAAFSRLIGVIRDAAGDGRDPVRVRLLELFDAVGVNDPVVLKARRELTSALF